MEYFPLIPAVAAILQENPTWDDDQIAAKLNQKDIKTIQSGAVMIRYRTLLSAFGPTIADDIIDALQAAAPASKTITRILPTVLGDSDSSGVDVANTTTRAVLDGLASADVLTVEQVGYIKSLGETTISLAYQAGFTELVGSAHVNAARQHIQG